MRTFNSPWECRIGLTIGYQFDTLHIDLLGFQFPVGMSNRSYNSSAWFELKGLTGFQFPVGMSNRSYDVFTLWLIEDDKRVFQFPVGMSNRSYFLSSVKGLQMNLSLFQFPVGMSNRSY